MIYLYPDMQGLGISHVYDIEDRSVLTLGDSLRKDPSVYTVKKFPVLRWLSGRYN